MNLCPKSVYVFLQLILNIVLCLFFAYLSVHAYQYLLDSIASAQRSPALGIPMYMVQSAPLTGFVLAMIRSFQQILLELVNVKALWNHKEIKVKKG